MEENSKATNIDATIIAHIEMLQGIIDRMARNCAACKNWSIMILSAILAFYFEEHGQHGMSLRIGYIPIMLFLFLDCYYLGKERSIIKKQNVFMDKVNKGCDISTDLFTLSNEGDCAVWRTVKAMCSFSTLPFYGFMFMIVFYLIHY